MSDDDPPLVLHGPNYKEARCGKWMPNAQEHCGLPEGHKPYCRTRKSIELHYAASNARRLARIKANQERVDRYKLEKGCIDCGYADHPVALDFDHRDSELKTANVSSILWKAWPVILREIEKCDLRCACCHRVKTHYRNEYVNAPRRKR